MAIREFAALRSAMGLVVAVAGTLAAYDLAAGDPR